MRRGFPQNITRLEKSVEMESFTELSEFRKTKSALVNCPENLHKYNGEVYGLPAAEQALHRPRMQRHRTTTRRKFEPPDLPPPFQW